MSTTFKNSLREVMNLAWQMVKRNGYTMSEAMKVAWANLKLKAAMKCNRRPSFKLCHCKRIK